MTRVLEFSISILIAAPICAAIAATIGYVLLPLAAVLLVCVFGWR